MLTSKCEIGGPPSLRAASKILPQHLPLWDRIFSSHKLLMLPFAFSYLIPTSLCLENKEHEPGPQVAQQITHVICKTRCWVGILKFNGLVFWRARAWEQDLGFRFRFISTTICDIEQLLCLHWFSVSPSLKERVRRDLYKPFLASTSYDSNSCSVTGILSIKNNAR